MTGTNVEVSPLLWNGVRSSKVWYDGLPALTLLERFRERNSVAPVPELPGWRRYARESLCCGERKSEEGA
jgi:hypothetical protein